MRTNAVPSLMQHVRRLAAATSTDEQLLADFLARRSEDAFAALLSRHGPMVLNVCRRILHDAHAAEDVFQATFLVLADRAGSIRRRASLAGFLHGVASRLAVRACRRGTQPLPATVCDPAEGPPEGLAWKEMLGILDHELARLSDPYRAPLVLCYLEGRTQDEAARQLGWGLNTLRRRLARGRQLLEARLRGRGVSLPAALAGVLAGGAAAVPAPLRAATLAAAVARAAGGLAAGAGQGIALLLAASCKKAVALVVIAALSAAACFGFRAMHGTPATDAPPAAAPADDPLPASGAVRFGTARYRHGSRIISLAVSADGKIAAAASGYGSFDPTLAGRPSPARVFDLTDGRAVYSLPNEPGDYTEAVGLSPDGKVLAIKDGKGVSFRDAATGKELRKLPYKSEPGGRSITDWMTFSPDGKRLAATLMGDATCLIDVDTATVIRTFASGGAASACVFSPDGKVMATGGYDLEKDVYPVRLWDTDTGKELRRFPAAKFPGPANGMKRALAFSPDGTMLAGGGWGDARLRLWEVATGKEPTDFPKLAEDVVSVAYAPDGKTVAAAADRVYLYDPATGKERLRIERRARRLAFSQDGAVLTGAVSGAIYRWDAATGRQLTPAGGQDSPVEQILVSADGRKVFITDEEGNLSVRDAAGPRRIATGVNRGVAASPDRRLLAWADRVEHGNTRIRLYDVAADRVIDPPWRSSEGFKVIGGEACVVGFLPDGKSVLTLGGGPPTFRVWDIESGKELRSFTADPPKSVGRRGGRLGVGGLVPFCTPRRAAISPDGKTLAIGPDFPEGVPHEGGGMTVRLWDVATGKAGRELDQPPAEGVGDEPEAGRAERLGSHWQMKSMDGRAFSPDGRLLVDWAENPSGRSRIDHVRVWDVATGRAVASLAAGPRPGAANAAFAPDGRTLATASADGVVRLWETATWTVRAEFRGHRDRITALGFGPDGRLYTGGLDTVVLGWDTRPTSGPAKGTLDVAWKGLADPDAKAGFSAQGRFLAEPARTVEWFATRVTPAVGPDAARVKAQIADLDSDDFATRERATAYLKEHWPATEAALREVAVKSAPLEARRRAERVIREMERAGTPAAALRALRAAEVLEWIATKEARLRLLELAKGAPEARLTREAAAASKRLAGR